MFRPKRRHIIIVRGIRLEELLSTPSAEKSYDDDDDAIVFFDEVPKTWTEGTELKPINLKCWNCDCEFNTPAAFIPLNPHRDRDGKVIFDRHGVYCSWPCAARDAYHRYSSRREYTNIVHSMAEVYYMTTGVSVPAVKMAPEKNVMAEYRGNGGMTRADYREAIREIIDEMA